MRRTAATGFASSPTTKSIGADQSSQLRATSREILCDGPPGIHRRHFCISTIINSMMPYRSSPLVAQRSKLGSPICQDRQNQLFSESNVENFHQFSDYEERIYQGNEGAAHGRTGSAH